MTTVTHEPSRVKPFAVHVRNREERTPARCAGPRTASCEPMPPQSSKQR